MAKTDFLDSQAYLEKTEIRAIKGKLAMGLRERGVYLDWMACLVYLDSQETPVSVDLKGSPASASASRVHVGHLGCLVKLVTLVYLVPLVYRV